MGRGCDAIGRVSGGWGCVGGRDQWDGCCMDVWVAADWICVGQLWPRSVLIIALNGKLFLAFPSICDEATLVRSEWVFERRFSLLPPSCSIYVTDAVVTSHDNLNEIGCYRTELAEDDKNFLGDLHLSVVVPCDTFNPE
ncbi:hypothetical protein HHI36_017500 [Cryptolaemus montrouzieri]|uniref:Uncharacterized protein n=1 Tax=Cryptolaemus montrouzieri TaxID=559131 RepID=A0ABD2NN71_9CUCU